MEGEPAAGESGGIVGVDAVLVIAKSQLLIGTGFQPRLQHCLIFFVEHRSQDEHVPRSSYLR